MTKTRSQVSQSPIKKEECEDKTKLNQLLHHTKKHEKKNRGKIAKNEKTAKAESMQVPMAKVKTENADENKVNLTVLMKTSRKPPVITKEQVEKLVGYIVNDKMKIAGASKKASIPYRTACIYYQQYKNDPGHKIPLPRGILNKQYIKVTQNKIEDLIHYITHDKMNVAQAAIKANMFKRMAYKYYKIYMEDPDHKIPVIATKTNCSPKYSTQKQIKELIGYIVDDGMSIVAASKKANVGETTARRYYLKYLWDPNHDIPVPAGGTMHNNKRCTNDQVKRLIDCIVDDKMSLLEASFKANMCIGTARKYYIQYLEDPNYDIPTPETDALHSSKTLISHGQLKIFFNCIIVDKLNVKEASLKAKISKSTGQNYYSRYLKNPVNMETNKDMSYSVEKMKKVVEYIKNDKITIKAAAMKVNVSYNIACKYYRRYLENPLLGISELKTKQYTQEDIKKLIDSIEHDNMNLLSAARKLKMNKVTATKYYNQYQSDPERKIPVPDIWGCKRKLKTLDTCSRLIADIYKNNPSIKPIHENYSHSDPSLPDIDIKQELLDDDVEMMLKDGE